MTERASGADGLSLSARGSGAKGLPIWVRTWAGVQGRGPRVGVGQQRGERLPLVARG